MLNYSVPATFMHSAIVPPDDYSSTECNASFQVYPFRPFQGDILQAFQTTLLQGWIDPRFREEGVAGPPEFRQANVTGADAAYVAFFADNPVGIPRPHMRLVIVSGGQAAIFDAQAINPQSWQMAQPSLNAVLGSLSVGAQPARPPIDDESRRRYAAVAGLYAGVKMKFVSDLSYGAGAGSGGHVPARHFYLFSNDGRVFRAYDGLEAPGGDPEQFDYDAALAQDPRNTGTYTVSRNGLHLTLGGSHGEPVDDLTVPAPKRGQLTIQTVVYTKQ
jgi:hypothetical protein